MVQDEIKFFGHPNIRSHHAKTIEITKDEKLSLRGDCIVGVKSNKACSTLDEVVKARIRRENSHVKLEFIVENDIWTVEGMGNAQLTLESSHDMVFRKSNFICQRTASVGCSMAAIDMPRAMISRLQNQETYGILRITLE